MNRLTVLLISGLLLCLAGMATAQSVPADLQKMVQDYMVAKSSVEQMNIAEKAISAYPDFEPIAEFIERYVDHAVHELGRVEEAAGFLKSLLPVVTNRSVKNALNRNLLRVYAYPGYGQDLYAFISTLGPLSEQKTDMLELVLNAAIGSQSENSLKLVLPVMNNRSNRLAVQIEFADEELSLEEINAIVRTRKVQTRLAGALLAALKGNYAEAEDSVQQARQLAEKDAFGIPEGRVEEVAGRIHLLAGDTTAAVPYLARPLAARGDSSLLPLLKTAWKDMNVEAGFEEYIENLTVKYSPILPDLKVDSPEGDEFSTRELQGKATLVVFWTTTCTKCLEELPALVPVYEELKEKGLQIIAIEGNRDPEATERFIKSLGLTYPVVIQQDGSNAAFDILEISSTPKSYLLDAEGRIVKISTGYAPGYELVLRDEILTLLNQ